MLQTSLKLFKKTTFCGALRSCLAGTGAEFEIYQINTDHSLRYWTDGQLIIDCNPVEAQLEGQDNIRTAANCRTFNANFFTVGFL